MNCAAHPDRETSATCSVCGRELCSDCLCYVNTDAYCEPCVEEFEREQKVAAQRNRRRMLFAGLIGSAVSLVCAFGWQWGMFQSRFSMAMLTPFFMFCVVIGLGVLMARISGRRSAPLFGIGAALTIGLMVSGEYVLYNSVLYHAAQQGLSAEKLLRYAHDYTFSAHLKRLGFFDYLFVFLALLLTWRRLWPIRSDERITVRPTVSG